MSEFDDLPLIQCKPQPVPVGHPEHPDFRGYENSSGEDYPVYSIHGYGGYGSVPGWVIVEAEED